MIEVEAEQICGSINPDDPGQVCKQPVGHEKIQFSMFGMVNVLDHWTAYDDEGVSMWNDRGF